VVVIRLIFGVALAVYLGSYLGVVHPVGDSLAVFRGWLGCVVMVLAWFAWRRGWVFAVPVLVTILAPYLFDRMGESASAPDAIKLYQKNLSFRLTDPQPILDDIAVSSADIVFLQEVDADNLALLDALRASYESVVHCGSPRVVRGVAVLWLVSVHWFWPYPHNQPKQAARDLELLRALDGPIFIGGDFNMVHRSHVLRQIKETSGTRRLGLVDPSFQLEGLLPIAIDHILTPTTYHGRIERRDMLGSDHHGFLAVVQPNS